MAHRSHRSSWFWLSLGAPLAVGLALVLSLRASGSEHIANAPWSVPQFELSDQSGVPVSNQSLRDHVWIADFIFTRCTSACPTLTARMRLLQRKLGHGNLRFVSFSVDPQNDTVAALLEYKRRWAADEARWHLLRTEQSSLRAVLDGMRVVAREVDDDAFGTIMHTSLFFLIDGRGRVLGMYDSNDARALERLRKDSQRALSGAAVERADERSGAALFADLGCAGCHDHAALAPSLRGLAGREVLLSDGSRVRADAAYLRESITDPARRRAAGYPVSMPPYESELSGVQLDVLVDYIRSLEGPREAATAAPATAEDPVCGMTVRVNAQTPRAQRGGHDTWFCSEACRAKFVAH